MPIHVKGVALALSFLPVFAGCGTERLAMWKEDFLIVPHEKASLASEDQAAIRQALFGEDYWILCVERTEGEVSPTAHYWFEHTFTFRVWPEEVSFENPRHISTNLIVDSISTRNGIAVKKRGDTGWRIYWLDKADIDHIKKHGVLVLPRYEELPRL